MKRVNVSVLSLLAILFLASGTALAAPLQQADNSNPPDQVVKLIFIHHSTGGNWLADPSENELGGDLGRALMENNYFVSATNYGWGPDSIGDATDIPNWLDWFRGENSATYLEALYTEDGQNFGDFGAWPRLSNHPGGENQVIMFKSCFPNSDLEGNPDDLPDPEGWLSVGHAKYVYNEILGYFATRPDKLFIVITAPPLSAGNTTPEHAANARALNEWLVNDWLRENDYSLNNVAVFDFYNILTGPDAHHWYQNSQIEHIVGSRSTLYYPSDDGEHPSRDGNRKAAQEFIPLLNIFVNRWLAGAPQQPPAATKSQPTATQPPPINASPSGASGLVDNFESGIPADTNGWEQYWDEAANTTLACAPADDNVHDGSFALKMEYTVAANSWATCSLSYGNQQDWSAAQGLSFYLHSSAADMSFDVDLYAGTPDNQETYVYTAATTSASTAGWALVQIPWADFHRADWEADAGTPFGKPANVIAIGFGVGTGEDSRIITLWVDDIQLFGGEVPPTTPPDVQTEEPQEEDGGGGLPCLGGTLLPLVFFGLAWLLRRR